MKSHLGFIQLDIFGWAYLHATYNEHIWPFRLYSAHIQNESCLLKCLGEYSYMPHIMTTLELRLFFHPTILYWTKKIFLPSHLFNPNRVLDEPFFKIRRPKNTNFRREFGGFCNIYKVVEKKNNWAQNWHFAKLLHPTVVVALTSLNKTKDSHLFEHTR